mgnify:CR=1 FL=1
MSPKAGIVFGYECFGHVENRSGGTLVYRFGRTAKTVDVSMYEEKDQKKAFIEKLGGAFGGLNRVHSVVLWAKASDIEKGWDLLKDYLRGNYTIEMKMKKPKIVQEMSLGDNFFSIGEEMPSVQFGELLKEATSYLFGHHM